MKGLPATSDPATPRSTSAARLRLAIRPLRIHDDAVGRRVEDRLELGDLLGRGHGDRARPVVERRRHGPPGEGEHQRGGAGPVDRMELRVDRDLEPSARRASIRPSAAAPPGRAKVPSRNTASMPPALASASREA